MDEEIQNLRDKLKKLQEENRQVAIFSLQTSFECKEYEDIPSKELVCPICETTIQCTNDTIVVSRNFWDTGEIKRIKCTSCQLIYGPLSVINKDPKRLSEDYKILYSHYQEGETHIYQRMAFEAIEGEKEKKYLNYACGTWKDGISELVEDGWNIYGYEPNLPFQHERIKQNMTELNDVKFDGLFTHNFIEHIQDPMNMFITWNKMLKIGDCMVHSSACFKWKFYFSNFHIFFFLGKSLEILAERTGFKVLGYTEYEPDNDALYTCIVRFEKVHDIDENIPIKTIHAYTKLGMSNLGSGINLSEHDLLIKENDFLKKRVEELTDLYEDIINSKSWKMTNKIKNMIGKK